MEAKASVTYVRISPRKAGIVCDQIRGKSVKDAEAILALIPKAASEPLAKLVHSAAANAENNHQMDPEKLYVAEVHADPGPIIKRYRPVSKGRAHHIMKRTSHLTVVLKEKEAK